MGRTVDVPVWILVLLFGFAAVTFASHFLFPSVRWFLRRRGEAMVARLNTRLARPIQPFKLARRTDTIMRLVHDPAVARAIADHARDEGVPEEVAFERARDYAREIVPGFSAILYFAVMMRLSRWLSQRLYDVRVLGRDRALDGVDPEATVVFVMNHRSNMDYVLVTWLASSETPLSYAVGEWARRWPLRPLIRALGGYFVRRRDLNPLYRMVLQRYVQIAARAGVSQAVFPEGRPSRDGALQPPKLGILSYLVDAHDPDGPDMVFVPVALNYDRVLEDRALIAADTGREAHPFRLRWWQVARYVRQRLLGRHAPRGAAAVALGRPLSLTGFRAPSPEDPVAALGDELMDRIADVLPALPTALASDAILGGASSLAEVREAARLRASTLGERVVAEPDLDAALATALDVLRRRRVVDFDGTTLAPRPDGKDLLRFYAATLPTQKPEEIQSYAGRHLIG